MTVPFERTRAVNHTRDFLRDLTNGEKTPRVPKYVRRRALELLRHYPSESDMDIVSKREDNVEMSFIDIQIFGGFSEWMKKEY